jgi:hypothetical protein
MPSTPNSRVTTSGKLQSNVRPLLSSWLPSKDEAPTAGRHPAVPTIGCGTRRLIGRFDKFTPSTLYSRKMADFTKDSIIQGESAKSGAKNATLMIVC